MLFEIVRTPAGEVAAGFTDGNSKPPRSLLLAVGEEAEGYRVVAADIDAETATLEKDGVRFELRMNSAGRLPSVGTPAGAMRPAPFRGGATNLIGMADFSGQPARRGPDAPAPAAAIPANQPVPNTVVVIDRLLNAGARDNSYVGRLQERRAQLLKQAGEERQRREQDALAQSQNVSKEVLDKRLRETNLNLIRKGLKPIGTIELTPEEDAKLVAEGVLPPAR